MPRLSLAHLQMLRAIHDSRSLGGAAERLGITPSALTHRLREAERRLGVALFSKVGRTARPTVATEILTEAAMQVLDRLELAERAAAASTEGVRHVTRLSVCDYNAYHWLPEFLGRFRRTHPEIDIEIEPNSTAGALKQIAEGAIDIAIVPDSAEHAALDGVALFEDSLVVVVWPGHRLAKKAFVTAHDLESETYLTYSLSSRPGFESERLWSREGTMPLRKRNLGSVDAVCELIKARAGVSVLSRWGITRELATGSLVARPAGPQGLAIVWRALLASAPSAHTPARQVANALAEWFQ